MWSASSAWPAGRSTPLRTAGPRPSTGRATSSTATPSTRWSPTPTSSSTSPSSSWVRGRRARGSTWPAPATCSRRRWRPQRPRRLVYTSSVAAYGYHSDNPVPITEEVPPRGSPEHYYSEQKAACEAALAEITAGSALEVFVLRPCIVAGPKAPALAEAMPWNRLPDAVREGVQGVAAAQAAVPRPGHAAATGSPRRRRRRDRFGRNHFRAAGRLQPRRRRRAVDVRCRRSARRQAGAGAPCRHVGGVRVDRPAAVRPVGAGVAARGPDVGGDGHRQGQSRSWAGRRNTLPPRRCRGWRSRSRLLRAISGVGWAARRGPALVGPVAAAARALGRVAHHVVVGACRVRSRTRRSRACPCSPPRTTR